jgi:hypothetical protein
MGVLARASQSTAKLKSKLIALAAAAAVVGTAWLAGVSPANAGTATVTPSDDTYSYASNKSSTHGTETTVQAEAGNNNERRGHLKFTVAGIPTGATNITATLRLYSQTSATTKVTFTAYQESTSWSQSTLAWSNQPALGAVVATKTGMTSGAYNTFNLSSLVTGNGTFAMALRSSDTSKVTSVTSKEGNSAQWPQLQVTWTNPPLPPTVTTGASSNIGQTAATMAGSVNPNGAATTCHFDYGTTTSYGSATANASAGSGSTAVNLTAPVTGLSPASSYHYRLACSNAGGTTTASDATFATAAYPPTVTTGSAANLTGTTATLNGTANANGSATTCHFDYGTTASYGTQTADTAAGAGTTSVNVSNDLSGLIASTYHYRLVCANSGGTSYGSDSTFTIHAPPVVVTGEGTNVTPSSATLGGSVNPSGDATVCHFDYGLDANYGSTSGDLSAGAGSSDTPVSATIGNLSAVTGYHFRLVCANIAGTTVGSDATFTTAAIPPVVTTLAAGNVTGTSATLNGSVNPNGSAASCHFDYGVDASYGSSTAEDGSPGAGSDAVSVSNDLSALIASTYHYRLACTNAGGTVYGADAVFNILAAPVATTGDVTDVTNTSATLGGSVDPNGSETVCHFDYGTNDSYGTSTVDVSAGAGSSNVPASAGIDGLTDSTDYHFRLACTNSVGTTYGDDAAFATAAIPVQVAPEVTSGAATNVTGSSATLGGGVNPNGAATTCHFEYGTDATYGFVSADADAGAGTTPVNVSNDLSGLIATTYHFRLVCANAGGTSTGADSTFVVQAPPAVTTGPAASVTATSATLSGTVNPNGSATTCHIDYGTSTAYGWTTPNDATPGAGTSNLAVSAGLTNLAPATTYHFRLSCSNAAGTQAGADATFATLSDLLSNKSLIYGSEIGAWKTTGAPAVTTSTGIPAAVQAAGMPVIRYAVYDCFVGETCGTDNHAGSLSRANLDTAISGITVNMHGVPWIKLLPITKAGIGTVSNGSVFCPATSNMAMNLPIYKSLMAEIRNVYSGPIIIESTNEGEYDCATKWGFASSGAVGVSKALGDHYVANMPPLIKYSRDTLGFSQVVPVGYVGIAGGTNWGQTCTANANAPYGYACSYQTRWVNEFNTQVQAAYVSHGNDPDYIPGAESIHAYCHSSDFGANPFNFSDNICNAYYRNWLTQSRAQVNTNWGPAIGGNIRFAISEWQAGVCTNLSTSCWSGWSTPATVQSFYSSWLGMLAGDGNTTGAGTRYWAANVFEIASNSDTGPGGYYNIIRQDGTTPAWYDTFKAISTIDPLR